MALTKVLIAVKTYPTLSGKYDELVCTAGFLEDGTWVRIYPIPFRKLEYDKQYSKYDWIEVDLERNTTNFRVESHKPKSIEQAFKIIEHLGTDDTWRLRKEIVLKNVYTNMTNLIAEAKDSKRYNSLAVFKPKEILDFRIEKVDRDWDKKKLDALKARAQQLNLFKNSENPFEVVQKLPFKFSYKFTSEDGIERTMMIEDWEIGQLYWNCLKRHEGNEMKDNFEYNDVRVTLLAYSLLKVWKKPLPLILKEKITDPIGASQTWKWHGYENSQVDIDGQKIESVSGGGHFGGGLFINTQDHARFGLLFLRNGKWNDQQLISREWVEAVQQPSAANKLYSTISLLPVHAYVSQMPVSSNKLSFSKPTRTARNRNTASRSG